MSVVIPGGVNPGTAATDESGKRQSLPARPSHERTSKARRAHAGIPEREAESAPYRAPRDKLDFQILPLFRRMLSPARLTSSTYRTAALSLEFWRASDCYPVTPENFRQIFPESSVIRLGAMKAGSSEFERTVLEMLPEKFCGATCSSAGHCLSSRPPLPRWRNWQTRQVQVLVGVISRGGSSPFLGIFKPESERTLRNSAEF